MVKDQSARRVFLPILFIPLFAVILYGNTFRVPFCFDDIKLIKNNPAIEVLSIDPGHRHRPVLMLSLAFNYHFSGKNYFGYHLTNILLHSLSAILIFTILSQLSSSVNLRLGGKSLPAASLLFASLFYAVQPLNTEAVTYVSGRSSSMSTFFLLLSFCSFFKSRAWGIRNNFSRKAAYLVIAFLAYCASIASKEIGIVLPCLLFAADYYFFFLPERDKTGKPAGLRNYWKERRTLMVPFFLIIVAMFAVRYHWQGAFLEKNSAFLKDHSRASYFYTQINVIPYYYLNKLFFPQNQNIDIYFDIYRSFLNPSTILAGLCLLILAGFAIKKRFTAVWFSFAVFWFFVTLAPTSSFVPILDVAVERRLYLPGISMSFLLLHFLLGFSGKKIMPVALVLVFFSTNTIQRNFVYKDGFTLWQDSASKSSPKSRAHYNLAVAYMDRKEYELALKKFNELEKIFPGANYIYFDRGKIFHNLKYYDRALLEYNKALVHQPEDKPNIYLNRGHVFDILGERKKAKADYQRALSSDPFLADAAYNLGVIFFEERRMKKARYYMNYVLKINPHDKQAGILLSRL